MFLISDGQLPGCSTDVFRSTGVGIGISTEGSCFDSLSLSINCKYGCEISLELLLSVSDIRQANRSAIVYSLYDSIFKDGPFQDVYWRLKFKFCDQLIWYPFSLSELQIVHRVSEKFFFRTFDTVFVEQRTSFRFY